MRQFTRFRLGQLVALAALAAVGAFAASPLASADGLLPTITTLTASVPDVTVPGVTTVGGTTETVTAIGTPVSTSTQTVTLPSGTQPSSGGGSSGSGSGRAGQADASTSGSGSSGSGAATSANTSAIKLSNGMISVSAASLHAPTRLLIYRLTYSPQTLRRGHAGQLHLTIQIHDTALHVVRGVTVSVRNNRTSSRAVAMTGLNGTASLYFAVPPAAVHTGTSLTVVVRAAAPTLSSQRTVRVAIKS
jgi:hypothetical protein